MSKYRIEVTALGFFGDDFSKEIEADEIRLDVLEGKYKLTIIKNNMSIAEKVKEL